VNNPRPLPAGAKVDVSISVFDGSGTLIGHLDDKRSVPNPTINCICSELDYSWHGDSLQSG
jgi:hypothetical protein